MNGLEALNEIKEKYKSDNGLQRRLKTIETALNEYEEHEKELIAEQHRLFDLCKEQEKVLKIIVEKEVNISDIKYCIKYNELAEDYNRYCLGDEIDLTQAEFELVKKVAENYGKINN